MQNPSDVAKPKASADERARLRRNQRNSRARKQEYVQDLEHRWSECVRLGVQASVEIQKEARRIHEENAALRQVIRELGMSDDALQHRLLVAMRHDIQNGDVPSATYPPTNTAPVTQSSAVQPTTFNQPLAALPLNDAHVSNLAGQTTVSDLPEINATDALQTWDLYSWINDLANIKDAYSFDPQLQVDFSDSNLLLEPLYHDSSNAGIADGESHGGSYENGRAWLTDELQSGSSNAHFMQSSDSAPSTNSHDASTWYSPDQLA